MKQCFKPSIWTCLTTILWLVWPVTMILILSYLNLLPPDHRLLDIVVYCGVLVGLVRELYLHNSFLEFSDNGLTIKNKLSNFTLFVSWKQLDRVAIEITRRVIFLDRKIVRLYYRDDCECECYYDYRLSELSETDQKK